MITTSDIAAITGGVLSGPGDITVSELVIDSRKSSSIGSGSLFIAIRGERNDGHDYILPLYRSGIRAFLIDSDITEGREISINGAAVIKTANSLEALHKIALYARERFTGTVVSVTGSTGKTVVKEWISDIIGKHSTVIRSPRSYNSQTGVPLSLWRLDNRYNYAVIEAGMSLPGEIERLERIIRPSVGIITNIGEAHQENFTSIKEKCEEKLNLFKNCETIIYCAGHELVRELIENDSRLNSRRLVSWSASEDVKADICIKYGDETGGKLQAEIIYGDKTAMGVIPFTDRASVENASAVIAAALAMGFRMDTILDAVRELEPVAMRMEKKEGINGSILIEDYYNSDPGSLGMALDHLKDLPGSGKTLIVSDFIQSGREMSELAGEILLLSARAGVDRFICIGPGLSGAKDLFPDNSRFFTTTAEFMDWFKPGYFSREAILLKGARIFRFEEISHLLEKQVHTTRLEINLNAVLDNLNYYRSKLHKGTRVMAMVKAFAYGAGSRDIAGWLNYNGIDFLTVAYTDEAIALRKAGVNNRIVVMSPDRSFFRQIIEYDLEPELFSLELIRLFSKEADRNGLFEYPVHIKLDTGMHRLGIEESDLDEAVNLINATNSVRIASVFSHLGSSENSEHDWLTIRQAELFGKMSSYIAEKTGTSFLRHLLNSSGIERFPQYQFDMVRIGIGLYFREEGRGRKKGQPGAMFKTTITQLKRVAAGEGIGYGFTDSRDYERTIAVVPVGYADGLMRNMGEGKIKMFVNGKLVPTVGRICMDMCMLDVTGVKVSQGDEVEIFGHNISIYDIAGACGTIPHEILTGIPQRVRRVFFYD